MNMNLEKSKHGSAADDHHVMQGSGIRSRIALGFVGLVALIGGFGSWAAMSELSGAVIGQGQVKVDKDLRAVQHLDGGIIKDIAARKGDAIQAGARPQVPERGSLAAGLVLSGVHAKRGGEFHEAVFALVQTVLAGVDRQSPRVLATAGPGRVGLLIATTWLL